MAIGVDVRTIATSNRDLPASVARGEFRQDLFFRLNVLPIHLLAPRPAGRPGVAVHFLAQIAAREGKPAKTFSNEAMTLLQSYRWPGNVRELSNICERAVLCKSDTIDLAMIEPWLLIDESAPGRCLFDLGTAAASPLASSLPSGCPRWWPADSRAGFPSAGVVGPRERPERAALAQESCDGRGRGPCPEDIERRAIVKTLNKYNGHRQRTAQALGIGVRTLGLKLKKWKELQLVEASL